MKLKWLLHLILTFLVLPVGLISLQGCEPPKDPLPKGQPAETTVGQLLTPGELQEFTSFITSINRLYFAGETSSISKRNAQVQELLQDYASDMDEADEIEFAIPYPHSHPNRVSDHPEHLIRESLLRHLTRPATPFLSTQERIIAEKHLRELGLTRWQKNKLVPLRVQASRKLKSREEYVFELGLFEKDRLFRLHWLKERLPADWLLKRQNNLEKRKNLLLLLAANLTLTATQSYVTFLLSETWKAGDLSSNNLDNPDKIKQGIEKILTPNNRRILTDLLSNQTPGLTPEQYLAFLAVQLGPPLALLESHGALISAEGGLELQNLKDFGLDEINTNPALKTALEIFLGEEKLGRILDPDRKEAEHTHGAVFLPPQAALGGFIRVFAAEKYSEVLKKILRDFIDSAHRYLELGGKVHSWENVSAGLLPLDDPATAWETLSSFGYSTPNQHLRTPVEEEQEDVRARMVRSIDRARLFGASGHYVVELYSTLGRVFNAEKEQIKALQTTLIFIGVTAALAPLTPVVLSLLPAVVYPKALELLTISFAFTYGKSALNASVDSSVADQSWTESFVQGLRDHGPASVIQAPFLSLLPLGGSVFNYCVGKFFVLQGMAQGALGAERCLQLIEEAQQMEQEGASAEDLRIKKAEAIKAGLNAGIDIGFSFLMNWKLSHPNRPSNLKPDEFQFEGETLIRKSDIPLWQKAFGAGESNALFPYMHHRPSKLAPEEFWLIFSKLPPEIQSVLMKAPRQPEEAGRFFEALRDFCGIRQLSFLSHFFEFLQSGKIPLPRDGHWLIRPVRNSLANLESLPPEKRLALEESVESLLLRERALQSWTTAFRIEIPVERIPGEGESVRVRIGDQTYSGFIQGEELILEVSRAKVVHRNDNPLEIKKIVGIAKDPSLRPSAYRVSLGLDGNFFLDDGNHRFSAFEQKSPTVRVVLPLPLRTVSLCAHLYNLGGTQPSLTAQIELYRTDMSLKDYLVKFNLLPERWIHEILF